MTRKKKAADLQQENKEVSNVTIDRLKRYGFQKGKSGNPKGRPAGTVTLANEIRNVFNSECEETGMSYLHTLLLVMIVESIEGDKETRQVLLDRGWGTLIQKNMIVGLTGEIAKFAKELGLDADDLEGSDTVRGLLEAATDNAEGFTGVETDSRSEEAETTTV